MPMIDGMEFLKIMDKQGIDIPTIIITGERNVDAEKLEQYSNVAGLLIKPFVPAILIEMIQESMRK
jgi:FixJ family two-component response regulator